MTNIDDEPGPGFDPAGGGLPEIADDDSYADDVLEAAHDGRDGPSPLPPDREDGPYGLDEYGTTDRERALGEPVAVRVARERPDLADRPAWEDPNPALAEDVDPDAVSQLIEDTRQLTEDGPVDPHLGSAVSMYDRAVSGIPSGDPIGRLAAPGGGYGSDEADEVADDVGPSAGGFGAEELAMHEMPPDQLDLEYAESTHEPYVSADAAPIVRTGPFTLVFR